MLFLYVDCIFIVGNNVSRIDKSKKELRRNFFTIDLGTEKCIIGMRVERDRKSNKLYLSQEEYIDKALHKFKMNRAT
jgi:hypothetical protein